METSIFFRWVMLGFLLLVLAVTWTTLNYQKETKKSELSISTNKLMPFKIFPSNSSAEIRVGNFINNPLHYDFDQDNDDHAWVIGVFIVLLGAAVYWTVQQTCSSKKKRGKSKASVFTIPSISKLGSFHNARAARFFWSRIIRKTGVALPLMILFIVFWLAITTCIVCVVSGWPVGQSFFYVVNTGFQRGFNCAYPGGPNSVSGTVVTFINKLLGAILFSTSLVLFLNSMILEIQGDAKTAILLRCSDDEALRRCLADVRTRAPFKTIAIDTTGRSGVANGIGLDTTGDCLVDTVVIKPPTIFFTTDRVYIGVAAILWHALGLAYGICMEGWGLGSSASFALTTLSIGGAMELGVDPYTGLLPERHAWALGLWIAVGVPLFASTVASYSSFLVEAHMRDHDRRALDEPISLEDYEVARRILRPAHHASLDRADFVILQLLRLGKADLTTVALILNKFEEVDLDGDDQLTEREVRAFLTGRSVRGERKLAVGPGGLAAASDVRVGTVGVGHVALKMRMDFSVFDMTDGAIFGRGEDLVGAFTLTGSYTAAGVVRMVQKYRESAGMGTAASGSNSSAPHAGQSVGQSSAAQPDVHYEGHLELAGKETMIRGTWTSAAPPTTPITAPTPMGADDEEGRVGGGLVWPADGANGGDGGGAAVFGTFCLRIGEDGRGRIRRLGSVFRNIAEGV